MSRFWILRPERWFMAPETHDQSWCFLELQLSYQRKEEGERTLPSSWFHRKISGGHGKLEKLPLHKPVTTEPPWDLSLLSGRRAGPGVRFTELSLCSAMRASKSQSLCASACMGTLWRNCNVPDSAILGIIWVRVAKTLNYGVVPSELPVNMDEHGCFDLWAGCHWQPGPFFSSSQLIHTALEEVTGLVRKDESSIVSSLHISASSPRLMALVSVPYSVLFAEAPWFCLFSWEDPGREGRKESFHPSEALIHWLMQQDTQGPTETPPCF
jgi:hypothetical protein